MQRTYIMTLMAANRVGILAALSTALDELGGNLLEVSQTVMRDYFTMILAAEFPETRTEQVVAEHIRAVGRPFNLQISIQSPSEASTATEMVSADLQPYDLTIIGPDRPGSLRQLAMRLAQEGINIVDLHATTRDDQENFIARFALKIPSSVDRMRLQHELADLGREKGFQMVLQHARVSRATQSPASVGVRSKSAMPTA